MRCHFGLRPQTIGGVPNLNRVLGSLGLPARQCTVEAINTRRTVDGDAENRLT